MPGWDGSHDWTGYIPFDELPYLYDPPSGIIVTANNAVVDAKFPYFIGEEWSAGYRAQRILQLLDRQPRKLTTADVRNIQGDTLVLQAKPFQAALASSSIAPATADGRTVLARILALRHDFCDTRLPHRLRRRTTSSCTTSCGTSSIRGWVRPGRTASPGCSWAANARPRRSSTCSASRPAGGGTTRRRRRSRRATR